MEVKQSNDRLLSWIARYPISDNYSSTIPHKSTSNQWDFIFSTLIYRYDVSFLSHHQDKLFKPLMIFIPVRKYFNASDPT
jgi:hypothetical protein